MHRVLLLHITTSSGHHRASCAIEHSLHEIDPAVSAVSVDAFHYTTPMVWWAIRYLYFSLIRHQPDVWEYLYDNPSVHRRVRHLRALLHRYHALKFARLLKEVQPQAIVCTQAYPCGVAADFKKHHGLSIPIVGVLTDYAPHLYWFHETVDLYVVPSEDVKRRFLECGVAADRVRVMGIPIDSRFTRPSNREETARKFGLDANKPTLLIMGGGSGFGQIREIVQNLDILPIPCQIVIVAGTNKPLLSWLKAQRFRQQVTALGFTDRIPELMDLATLLISKPGGMTTSEALTKQLPMVIVNPIPGQEAYNARFLLGHGAAVQASRPATVRQTVRDLLEQPQRLEDMRRRSARLAHPYAAQEIARLTLSLCKGMLKQQSGLQEAAGIGVDAR